MSARDARHQRRFRALFVGICLPAIGFSLGASSNASAESRGWVISMVHTATYANKDACPVGGPVTPEQVQIRALVRKGLTEEEAKAALGGGDREQGDVDADNPAKPKPATAAPRPRRRRPENPSGLFPARSEDTGIETAVGRYAYGFNLNGKVEPDSFEDPESHERGVDNNMWRVLGCFEGYHVRKPVRPYSENISFDTSLDAMPAWLMWISGADLTQDGPVTVTFDRALNVAMRNGLQGLLGGASYTIDPDPRWHSENKGQIKDQVLTIEPGEFKMAGDSQWYPVLRLLKARLRFKIAPDGSFDGFIGGYQPFKDFFHFLAIRGEGLSQTNLPGVYYAMKRLAEEFPDPVTGENTAISATYRMQGIPAFLLKPSGQLAAVAVGRGPRVNSTAMPEYDTETPASGAAGVQRPADGTVRQGNRAQ
jgi:hypothetical protein